MTPQNGYVWLLPSWLAKDWWDTGNGDEKLQELQVPCSRDEMKEFVSGGYFSLSNAFYGNSWDSIRGSLTVSEWKKEYREKVKQQVKWIGQGFWQWERTLVEI